VHGAEGKPPSARDVIARGRTDLADALRLAARRAWQGDTPREVVIVVDVTPYTGRWDDVLTDALFDVEVNGGAAAGWRIARLGERPSKPVESASLLATQLHEVLAHETNEVSTLDALARTLRGFPARGGVVVYLADWRFEDDHDLEGVLGTLRTNGQTLSVVGSEAAHGRGWNDGFDTFGPFRKGPDASPYLEGIGRNPFGGGSADEPWHGGDTAYPHTPWRFEDPDWRTEFGAALLPRFERPRRRPEAAAGDALEDLRERLRREVPRERAGTSHALPSSWGPYGLMRLAAETGGRYVLWSWNPNGRSNVTYDYARCDLFPPDLRSRNAIRSDIAARPLAAALVKAWHAAAERKVGTVTVSPPLARNLRGAREMMEVNRNSQPPWVWTDRSQRDEFVRRAEKAVVGLDRALTELDRAIAGAGAQPDDVDMRYLADAHHLAHALRAQRFGLGEGLAVARDVPDSAWDGERYPGLRPVTFIARGADPEDVRALCPPVVEDAIGARLVDERKRALQRYAGTPVGETVARNDVFSYELTELEEVRIDPQDVGRSPAQSDAPPPPTTNPQGGGSSGSGGAGTGR
jgi:hypothetical protein